MTSQINPATIDGNYPIAGVPNNTQGMRDNFTAIKTNFQFAETEIDELQSKGMFKAALTGTTLDNNMANNLIYNARIQGFSGTLIQIANTSGAITVDCSAGPVQTIVMGGNISVSFTTATWPAAGSVGIIRLIITVDQADRTLTLPSSVSLGTTGIQGYSTNVITFAAAGTYEFGFLTYDQGTTITLFDYNRPLNYYTNSVNIADATATTSAITGALTVAGGVGIGGNLYVTGDIFGNVTLTDITVGTVTATGNIIGGNVKTAGLISATGNITGGNILGGANVNSTLFTGTTVSVTGNVNGGNLIAATLAQTATLSATGAVTFSGTATNQAFGTSQTTGTLALGGAAQTGTITVGQSTDSQTTNIQTGATATAKTKAINIGTGGLAGSTTTIAIGPVSATTAAATATFNTATTVAIANTSGAALSVAGNVVGGNVYSGTIISAGVAAPTAVVHIKAGTASASTAPMKLTSGTNLTTAEAGAFEYDGTTLNFTPSTNYGRAAIPTAIYTSGTGTSLTATAENTYQALFPSANDTITLPIGTYEVTFNLTATRGATSATSAQLRLKLDGSAGLAVGSFSGTAIGSIAAGGATSQYMFSAVSLTADNLITAASTTISGVYNVLVTGILRITTAGTFTPQYSLSAALAGATTATVPTAQNYLMIRSVATSGSAAATGAWG